MYDVPFIYRVLDKYLKRPLLYDILISGILCVLFWYLNQKNIYQFESNEIIQSINTDLISITISLAGFILAALTILVTFKDTHDAKSKSAENSKDGKELFFSSLHYFKAVRVFYRAAFILLLFFLILSIAKLGHVMPNRIYYSVFSVFCIVCITLTVMRSLYLLTIIIRLQTNREEGNSNN